MTRKRLFKDTRSKYAYSVHDIQSVQVSSMQDMMALPKAAPESICAQIRKGRRQNFRRECAKWNFKRSPHHLLRHFTALTAILNAHSNVNKKVSFKKGVNGESFSNVHVLLRCGFQVFLKDYFKEIFAFIFSITRIRKSLILGK